MPDSMFKRKKYLRLLTVAGSLVLLDQATKLLVFSTMPLYDIIPVIPGFFNIVHVHNPGGAFVFITPNKRHPLIGLNRLVGRAGTVQDRLVHWFYGRVAADTYPAYYKANSPTEISRLAQGAGMDLIELRTIADPTYLAFRSALFHLLSKLESNLPASRAIHLVGLACRRQDLAF